MRGEHVDHNSRLLFVLYRFAVALQAGIGVGKRGAVCSAASCEVQKLKKGLKRLEGNLQLDNAKLLTPRVGTNARFNQEIVRLNPGGGSVELEAQDMHNTYNETTLNFTPKSIAPGPLPLLYPPSPGR